MARRPFVIVQVAYDFLRSLVRCRCLCLTVFKAFMVYRARCFNEYDGERWLRVPMLKSKEEMKGPARDCRNQRDVGTVSAAMKSKQKATGWFSVNTANKHRASPNAEILMQSFRVLLFLLQPQGL